MNATQEKVTLYFKEGSSDKVYAAQLEPKGSGWVVNFQYGRRGSTMNTGTKTTAPVTYEKAKSIFDKLVREKTAKGYTAGEGATPYTGTSSEESDTGERPQLLNDVDDEAHVERLIKDPAWGMQEKMDGRRRMVKKKDGNVTGINRKGLAVGLPDGVFKDAEEFAESFTLDGESIGDVVFSFDLLDVAGDDLRKKGFAERFKILREISEPGDIQLVPLAVTEKEKRALFDRVKKARGEGVVFKRLDAPYTAGRPNSGGTQLRYKFKARGSFIVAKVNTKRSVEVKLFDGTLMGNVTITPNKAVPAVGDIVEVEYLYCFKGGSLYQPVYLEVRDDIDAKDCTDKQLKYKAGLDGEDA